MSKYRINAVSYLNTVPLVWGMLHGEQAAEVDLSFSIPSACAEHMERHEADLGLAPVAEIARQGLETIPGLGIACDGPVRSILLFARVAWNRVRTLAADSSSRTSVELARIILRERYGAVPKVTASAPDLETMLAEADSALIIGDPALRIEPNRDCLDLGAEWLAVTGLPMVFAQWAARPGTPLRELARIVRGSYEFGKARLGEIVEHEYAQRGISRELADAYLRRHILYELGPREEQGLDAYLELANLKATAERA